jgi:hypothetical protein
MGGKAAMCFAAATPKGLDSLVVALISHPNHTGNCTAMKAQGHYDILNAMKEIDLQTFLTGHRERDMTGCFQQLIKQGRIRAFLMKNLGKDDDDSSIFGNLIWMFC